MAAKKKSKSKSAPKKAKSAPKKKAKSAPKKAKQSAPKKQASKKKASKKKASKKSAPKKKAAPRKSAPKKNAAPKMANGEAHEVVALPGRKSAAVSTYKGANLDHHPVSKREMDDVAREGLRGDGEILHVEEADFAPCRLVDHGEGRFSLCFDDFRMPPLALFEERGLQGGGYTWEAVVSSLVKLRRPDLEPELTYDSESGMFVALGSREGLKGVAKLIQQAIASETVLREAVDAADPDRLE